MADYNRIKASVLTLSSALSSHVESKVGVALWAGPKQFFAKGVAGCEEEGFVVRCE